MVDRLTLILTRKLQLPNELARRLDDEDILQVASSRGVLEHFGAGHQRDACLPSPGAEPAFARHVFGLSVSGEHRIEAVVERLA